MILQHITIRQHILYARLKSDGLRHKTANRGDVNTVVYPRLEYQLVKAQQMTRKQYQTALAQKLAFYGFTSNPLTNAQTSILWHDKISLDSAYGIACDVNAGFSFAESLDANA